MVNWLHSKIETITGAAAILAGASLASKLLGLLRNRVLAGSFGAGDTLDAYYAAFRIPDAIFQFVVLGALSAGFIPVFIELMEKTEDRRQKTELTQEKIRPPSSVFRLPDTHWRVAVTILNAMLIILVATAVLFIIFARPIQGLVAPGFTGDKFELTVKLARIMALGPIFLGISAVFSGILQSYRRFLMYSIAPLFYNLGIIIGALWFSTLWGPAGLAIGVVLGTSVHMLAQWPTVHKVGFRWRWIMNLSDPAVKKIAKLSIPRILGLAVAQINFFIITIVASKLASGSLSVFNLANDLQSVPIGLFGISLATAAFPAFSQFAARKDHDGLRDSIVSTARLILFLTIPFAILLLLLRAQIVRVLFGWGEFDWADTIDTADTLAFFSLSLFAQGLLPLLARGLYALKDTVSPLVAGLMGVLVNLVLALLLKDSFGIAGLALAFSAAAIVNVVVLWMILRTRLGSLNEAVVIVALFKISGAAMAMTLVIQAVKYTIAPYLNMQTGIGIFTQGFTAGILGLAVFLITAIAMGSEEAERIKDIFKKKVFKLKESTPTGLIE